MASSLIKYHEQKQQGGKHLFWNRIHEDHIPFRGSHDPMLTEDERESRVVRIAETHARFFDMGDPKEADEYVRLLDRAMNGWYKILYLDRFWRRTTKHYVEWAEYYLEDGKPTAYGSGVMELAHGQSPGLPHFGPGA